MSFPVDPVSAAMKWRENLIVVYKDYCENTTLHGYKYLVLPGRKIYERLMWLTVVVAAIFATVVLFKVLLTDYWSTPTVTTQDSSKYPIRKVPFPGIAICDINKISKKNAMNLAVELYETFSAPPKKGKFIFTFVGSSRRITPWMLFSIRCVFSEGCTITRWKKSRRRIC